MDALGDHLKKAVQGPKQDLVQPPLDDILLAYLQKVGAEGIEQPQGGLGEAVDEEDLGLGPPPDVGHPDEDGGHEQHPDQLLHDPGHESGEEVLPVGQAHLDRV